eukprot:2674717-Alexandrium_andersonii.AAC.1
MRAFGARRPCLLEGSPPRADWCSLNVNVNHPRMDPREVQSRRRRARVHLEFVVQLYLLQLEGRALPARAPGRREFMERAGDGGASCRAGSVERGGPRVPVRRARTTSGYVAWLERPCPEARQMGQLGA